MTTQMIHSLPRATLPENGVVTFEVAGDRYLVADLEGDVRAFRVVGPAAAEIARATVADGRVRCPLHGWSIDPDDGRCGAADACRYRPLPVELGGDDIRVSLLTS